MEGGKYSFNGRRRLAAVLVEFDETRASGQRNSAVFIHQSRGYFSSSTLFSTITESTSFQAEPKP
jgi:hypothetical protein